MTQIACDGNSSEICGGPVSLDGYNYMGTDFANNGGLATVFLILSGLPTG